MEKRARRSGTLNGFLLGYLIRTGLVCAVVAVLWFFLLLGTVSLGFVLPAYAASDATLQAMEQLPAMSADHFAADSLPELCRWVLLDGQVSPGQTTDARHVLDTNMSQAQLSLALALGSPLLYTQFYRDVPLIDGTLCRLQYDFSMPYADPALRGVLPDYQLCTLVMLLALEVAVVFFLTRRAARQLRSKTSQLTGACRILAAGDLAVPLPSSTGIRELDTALQTMEELRGNLADALGTQWAMEQQRIQRMAALTHDLKTPLTILQGNAELLAEEDLTPQQRTAAEAMLRSSERAAQYLAALREVCRTQSAAAPSGPFTFSDFWAALCQTARSLCSLGNLRCTLHAALPTGATLQGRRQDLLRALENLVANAVRFTPEGGQLTLTCRREEDFLVFSVQDSGPGFPPAILQQGGRMFSTGDTSRGDGHQGLGLYFARTVAEAHQGELRLSNTEDGARAEIRLPARLLSASTK